MAGRAGRLRTNPTSAGAQLPAYRQARPASSHPRRCAVMTPQEAIVEVERRRAADPGASWIASLRHRDWIVVSIGVAPSKVVGTATKPPPVAPRDDPHSPIERAAWFAGGAS